MNPGRFTRRNMFVALGMTGLGAAGAIGSSAKAGTGAPNLSLSGPYLDVGAQSGDLLARARLFGNVDPSKKRFDCFEGQVMAVAPNGNVMPFAGIRGWIETDLRRDEHGWRRYRRVFGTYHDASGKPLVELHNPFNGDRVSVQHLSGALSVDSIEANPVGRWGTSGANFDFQDSAQICLQSNDSTDGSSEDSIDELAGFCITSHTGAIADLQNPKLTTVPDRGTLTMVTDWLPWLKMGRAPGHCLFQCQRVGGFETLADLPISRSDIRHA